MTQTFIATAAFGLEGVVADELKRMGVAAKAEQGGARFEGEYIRAFEANLWLRAADRVLMVLGTGEATSFEALYQLTRAIPFEKWIPKDAKLPVTGKCVRSQLMSVRDCQSIVKKAIVDRLCQSYQLERLPETGDAYPIDISISKDEARLTLDFSGTALNRRGYRTWNGEAPLRETLAAALIQLSPWRKGMPLYDPCCGTGTLMIEAAMIETNRAPGLEREFACERFGFMPKSEMKAMRDAARTMVIGDKPLQISGSDIDSEAITLCRRHIAQAGFEGRIDAQIKDLRQLTLSTEYGVFLCNPPYGERLSDQKSCQALYRELGALKRRHPTWRLAAITSDPAFERFFGQKAYKKRRLYNGRLECELFIF